MSSFSHRNFISCGVSIIAVVGVVPGLAIGADGSTGIITGGRRVFLGRTVRGNCVFGCGGTPR
jgi:hypothetical protein